MKRYGFLLIVFTLLSACQKDYDKTKQAYQFIPSESSTIIQVNELSDFLNSLEHNAVFSGLFNSDLKKPSSILKHLNTTKQVYLAFTDSKHSDYVILTENDSTLFVVDSLPNHISETLVNFNINKTQIDEDTIYHKIIGKTFAGSNNLELIKNLNSKNENATLSKLIETTNEKSVASLVFKSEATSYSKLLFTEIDARESTNFTVLDFNNLDQNLHYNGILTSQDSISHYLDGFKNTIPQKTNTPFIAPSQTQTLVSISYDDFSVFNKNRAAIQDKPLDNAASFLNFTNEIALIDNALLLHTLDAHLILESIEDKSNIENFRDFEIYEFGDSDFFKTNLQPFISFENANYFAVFENFMVFSDTTETLKSILTNALNNNTLGNSDAFQNINAQLSDEASLFIFKNADGLSEILGESIKGYNANAVQFIREDHYTHINGIIQKFKKSAVSNSVTEAFTTQIEATILSAPQTVKNHVSKAHDIIVQDINNQLHLISGSGNILWKKQLQGKILGQVEQIDMYKNGRLQLAFATPNRLYVLDRNGNDVSPFPLKFKDPITQPLSVFDYDKRKDYRLLVTQGKSLLMYTAKGQSVSGFDYKDNSANITTQPKHFRIGTKDYLVFGAGKSLQILNRQGTIRVKIKDQISFSENDVFLYQNKFTTTNTLGQLVQIDTHGKLSSKDLNLTDKHNITTTSKTLVSLKENKLQIKSRTVDLDYGDYTAPRIFYLNDKIYVTTTDLQSKKAYLFDSQAKPIPNFPVFGTASATLEQLDSAKGLELITQGDDKTVVIYKIN
ncbi:MAG: ribonuclease HII [Winogradskyella sp.]|uniref:ribonuclease HII n=1 Tax=Winogradskyella sp. TaxID=1883156 RepID=UPI00385C1830